MRRLRLLLLLAPLALVPAAGSAPMALRHTIGGHITPKSVVSSQTGRFFAQNMMYTHTITVYDRRYRLVKTISDRVDLRRFGFRQYAVPVQGAPVEVAFTRDGRYASVSNYSMYGPGFAHPGDDVCSPASGVDRSFVYRIAMDRLAIDQVIRVGAVPKFLAVTADGATLLVSNWCSYDLSVVSTARHREVRRLRLGAYPRGIAIDEARHVAYVAVMGSRDVARVRLDDLKVSWIRGVGNAPRHLVLDPGGRYLYATLNGEGTIAKIALPSGRVVSRTATGTAPRSMTIDGSGRYLWVVNYESNTVAKVRARDMRVVDRVPTAGHPIGITYDRATNRVWVACYSGVIEVFAGG
jgi:DNA-binding beta-propeller fold protein YncE